MKISKRFLAFALLVVAVLAVVAVLGRNKAGFKKAYVGQHLVWVKLAETPQARQQGLSGVKKLDFDQGMLFVFSEKGTPVFWMKEMNFALDFVWIGSGKVADLTENVPPPSVDVPLEIARVQPNSPVDMALEVNAGWIKNKEIKIGDSFKLKD